MIDWNDYRLFATLARIGSVRRAANELGTSHSTLSRRISGLENELGVALFERSTTGFALTDSGRVLQRSIAGAADAIDQGRRALDGADARMAGPLRVTMPDLLAYHLLLPAIRLFTETWPDVSIEVDVSYEAYDLGRREADVAVRMVHLGQSPPGDLVGRHVATSHATGYASPGYLSTHDLTDSQGASRWLGWADSDDGVWIGATSHPHLPKAMALNGAELQRHAARAGLGLAYIPCILGDRDAGLVRVPGARPRPARDIWVLTHADLRETARMRAFRNAMGNSLSANRVALEGRSVRDDDPAPLAVRPSGPAG